MAKLFAVGKRDSQGSKGICFSASAVGILDLHPFQLLIIV